MASCMTNASSHEFEYQWVIRKFALYLQCSKDEDKSIILESSSFTIGDSNPTSWHERLDLHGATHPYKDFVGIYTYYESIDTTPIIWASGEYFLVDSTNGRHKLNSYPMTKFHAGASGLGFPKLFPKDILRPRCANFYLPNDELTIICRMTVMSDLNALSVSNSPLSVTTINNHVNNNAKFYLPYDKYNIICQMTATGDLIAVGVTSSTPESTSDNLVKDYAKLYLNERFSDVTFIVGADIRIPAHKIILVARSSVFAAFFEDKSTENVQNVINISNMDPEIFKRVLRYIYTNEIPTLDDNTIFLMIAADSYGLQELKKICEDHLCKNITIQNVMIISLVAERHNAERLLEASRTFQVRICGLIDDASENSLVHPPSPEMKVDTSE